MEKGAKSKLLKLVGIGLAIFLPLAAGYCYIEYRRLVTSSQPQPKKLTIKQVDLGTLPDTNKSRIFVAKQLARALKSNPKADKIGVVWKYDTGLKMELGYDRYQGYLYAQANGVSGACGAGEKFVLQRIESIEQENVTGMENPAWWDAGCMEIVIAK